MGFARENMAHDVVLIAEKLERALAMNAPLASEICGLAGTNACGEAWIRVE